MNPIKVLLVSSEAAPFAKIGGLADVVGSLPRALNQNGCDARIIMPLYQMVKKKHINELDFLGWKMVKMGWRSVYAGLFSMNYEGVTYYFIDNEYYFHYDQVYVEYVFDIERYCFFQRAVLEFMGEFMGFMPDVLHGNDWQSGMIPLLLDAHYRPNGMFENLKTVYTIHNLKYQGIHGVDAIKDLMDLPDEFLTEELSLKEGAVNFMKAGIVYSNSVTTVSPTYAYEIMTDYYGEGLNNTLQRYAYKVTGILNGINSDEFDPSKDDYLPKKYSVDDYQSGKAVCKRIVQAELGLDENPGAPMCVMVTRLVDQKGMDLFLRVVEEMLFDGMQVVVLGTGNSFYERTLLEIAKRNPLKMAAWIYYDNAMAHKLYAAGDMFLMPSLFEPCGLSQMISMRYGTIPIVRETGGLKDTVHPYNEYTGEGNGFSFANINAHEFLFVTKYACDLYRHHKKVWDRLVVSGMNGDYTWSKSAVEYIGLYSLISGIPVDEAHRVIDTMPEPKSLDRVVAPVHDNGVIDNAADIPVKDANPAKTSGRKASPTKASSTVSKTDSERAKPGEKVAKSKTNSPVKGKKKDNAKDNKE